ncbi:MAG TPA: beta-L-arabinofuranosidase domain-containing protein, partial [Tepidisphaeraceae bacterium]|nr:beta-L-arabinofuranosidase domain-containing protein [Tepidisphaeraceae bacterium]
MSRQLHVAIWLLMTAAVAAHAADRPKPVVPDKAPIRLQTFSFGQVLLGPGPLQDAFQTNVRYLHSLKPDRYLWTFRKTAGLDTPDTPYGGWEEPNGELRGHSLGHYLSVCARVIAQTGDPELKKNADYTVAELAKCQAKLGGGYLSAFPAEFFDRVDRGQRVWAPYYTIHKIMLGLWEMYAYAGNTQALDVLKGMGDYFKARCDKLNDEQMQKMLKTEFGGMHEVLLNLYSSTGDKKYFDLAQRFVKASFIDPLADGKDNLPGIHANTHIPQIAGQARAYELTGNKRNRKVVEFFWDTLISAHSYATGGSNVGEHWGQPNKLANTLAASNQEFCTSYNLEKIGRYLLKWTAEPRYADLIERNFYNGILVSQDPKTGMFIYYMPFKTGLHKDHGSPFNTFTCCYGTGIQEYASLVQDIFYHADDTLYVNLFANAVVTWNSPRGDVRITQQTDYPAQQATSLKISAPTPTKFKLALRVPAWATQGITVKVNGEDWSKARTAKPGSWLTLSRTWNANDTVEMAMPMSLHVQPMNDDPNLAAIMYGPLVLAGLVDTAKSGLDLPAPVFSGDMKNPAQWIKPVEDKPLTFRTTGQPTDITLIPIHQVVNENYGLYWRFAPAGSPALADYQESLARITNWQKRVIDSVAIGNERSEKSHNLQGANTQAGTHPAGAWRHAGQGGFFSYALKVDPTQDNILAVTFWGSDAGDRIFDILVDGTRIATQALHNNAPDKLFIVEYPIPRKLTADKSTATVRFEPAPNGKTAGGIFALVMLRSEQPTTPAAAPSITIEAAKVGQPISKYIYGQFIEHLGRCIYGGIWAEMLEDRKFYFAVGAKESVWKPIGGEQAVTMVRQNPFVGEHTPQVNLAGDGTARGIVQSKLALLAGKTYVGRIWLAGDSQVGPVSVSLVWGDDPKDRQTVRIDSLNSQFTKTPLNFTAGAATNNARLEITATGAGTFRIGTLSL